jgi:hypothetical protein
MAAARVQGHEATTCRETGIAMIEDWGVMIEDLGDAMIEDLGDAMAEALGDAKGGFVIGTPITATMWSASHGLDLEDCQRVA